MDNLNSPWYSLDWFTRSTINAMTWENELFLYLIPIVPILFLARWLIRYFANQKLPVALIKSDLKTSPLQLLRFIPEITLMIVLATVLAPITEELLFRATLFRFLRTRAPRWIALFVPGTIFAALHVNWTNLDGLASLLPLVTLAVVFSIAYERTGRIGTAMIAHGLFNLHTVVLLLSGATS